MSYLNQTHKNDEYHEHILCSSSEVNSLVFDMPQVFVIIYIPAHRNENIVHFCCLMVDRFDFHFHLRNRRVTYDWYDPIGKPPSFYKIQFPFEVRYEPHVSYMSPESRTSGFYCLHFIEWWYQDMDHNFYAYKYLMCKNGKALYKRVQLMEKMENITVSPTPQKILLPAEQREVVAYYYNREE